MSLFLTSFPHAFRWRVVAVPAMVNLDYKRFSNQPLLQPVERRLILWPGAGCNYAGYHYAGYHQPVKAQQALGGKRLTKATDNNNARSWNDD